MLNLDLLLKEMTSQLPLVIFEHEKQAWTKTFNIEVHNLLNHQLPLLPDGKFIGLKLGKAQMVGKTTNTFTSKSLT